MRLLRRATRGGRTPPDARGPQRPAVISRPVAADAAPAVCLAASAPLRLGVRTSSCARRHPSSARPFNPELQSRESLEDLPQHATDHTDYTDRNVIPARAQKTSEETAARDPQRPAVISRSVAAV